MPKSKQHEKVLPDLIAQLQLENYLVDDLTFKSNAATATNKSGTIENSISIDFDVKPHAKDKNRFLILMEVDLNKGQQSQKVPNYQVHLHLLGWFKFTNEIDDQTKHRMMFTNGSSILYGIARAVVANLTGSIGSTRFILPSLNLLSIVKQKAQSEKAAPARPRTKT